MGLGCSACREKEETAESHPQGSIGPTDLEDRAECSQKLVDLSVGDHHRSKTVRFSASNELSIFVNSPRRTSKHGLEKGRALSGSQHEFLSSKEQNKKSKSGKSQAVSESKSQKSFEEELDRFLKDSATISNLEEVYNDVDLINLNAECFYSRTTLKDSY